MPVPPRLVFWGSVLPLLPIFLVLSTGFGATWDEYQQHDKARRLLQFWAGERPSIDEPIDGAHLYGALLEVISLPLARRLGADEYVVGHAVTAQWGWLGIVLAGLLAARLFDLRHGLLTMALLVVTPQYVAHSMNNPKDLPFATVATASLLAMTYVARHPPFLGLATGAGLALILGVGLNVRAGALLFAGYTAVLIGYYASVRGTFDISTLAPAAVRVLAVVAGAMAIGWIAWPWAYEHPLTASIRAMRELSRFPWGGFVLFGGADVPSDGLPWTYVPLRAWLTMPPVLLAGAVVGLGGMWTLPARERTMALLGAVLFPIVFVVGTGATLYDGLRHLLFVVPPLAVLAAAGWLRLMDIASPRLRLAVVALLAIGLAEPLWFQWRNHPNQIAYVQPLAGGPSAAFARYDLDYWGNCVLQSMGRLSQRDAGGTVRVTGWPLVVLQMNASRFPGLQVVEPGGPATAAYSIELVRGRRAHVLALAASPDVIDRVTTSDGAVLCVTRAASSPLPPALFPD